MVVVAGRQVSEHGIDAGWQGHQISGIRGHDLIDAPSQIIECHIHVKCRTDIQSDHQSVQFTHDDVLEATSHELFSIAKYFWSDETSNVVEVNPWLRTLTPLLPGQSQVVAQASR